MSQPTAAQSATLPQQNSPFLLIIMISAWMSMCAWLILVTVLIGAIGLHVALVTPTATLTPTKTPTQLVYTGIPAAVLQTTATNTASPTASATATNTALPTGTPTPLKSRTPLPTSSPTPPMVIAPPAATPIPGCINTVYAGAKSYGQPARIDFLIHNLYADVLLIYGHHGRHLEGWTGTIWDVVSAPYPNRYIYILTQDTLDFANNNSVLHPLATDLHLNPEQPFTLLAAPDNGGVALFESETRLLRLWLNPASFGVRPAYEVEADAFLGFTEWGNARIALTDGTTYEYEVSGQPVSFDNSPIVVDDSRQQWSVYANQVYCGD